MRKYTTTIDWNSLDVTPKNNRVLILYQSDSSGGPHIMRANYYDPHDVDNPSWVSDEAGFGYTNWYIDSNGKVEYYFVSMNKCVIGWVYDDEPLQMNENTLMSKFINPGAITHLHSPLNIKLLLDHARHDVLRRIEDKERADRKRDEEWYEYVKYYNIMNEIADRFYNELDAQGCEGPIESFKKTDDILFPRLKFGPDKDMKKKGN